MPDKAHEFAGMKETPATSSTGLDALLRAAAASGEAGARPVEKWNPPYCGDIGMKIRRDGTWAYQGSPIGRIAMVKLFASILRKDDDGKTYLVTPAEKVDVEVEDAPFLAVEMAVSGEGRDRTLTFRTNVDDIVTVDADHPLRFERSKPDGGLKTTSSCAGDWKRSAPVPSMRSLYRLPTQRMARGTKWVCGAAACGGGWVAAGAFDKTSSVAIPGICGAS